MKREIISTESEQREYLYCPLREKKKRDEKKACVCTEGTFEVQIRILGLGCNFTN